MPIRNLTLVTATIALGLSFATANAIEEVGQAYITPMGTYINPDGDLEGDKLDDGIQGGQLAVGYALEDHWDVELALQRFSIDAQTTDASLDQSGLVLNLLNVYNRSGRFSPYILAGVGLLHDDVSGVADDEDNFQAQGGLGLFASFGKRLALRSEVLYRWEDASESLDSWLVNVGLQIAIGSRKEAPAPVAAADPDTDGDGVVDRLDQCPNTPKGATVNGVGCPMDSDGDGVFDGIDQCPNTPQGARVNSTGCPLDSDGDGVYDGIDQCPDTPKGAKVDARGCETQIILRGVTFDNDSDHLTAQSTAILDSAVTLLKQRPNVPVEIRGHTDSNGSDAHNMKLSERRANRVRQYFISNGIDASRMTTKAFGESKPLASNDTPEGREQNRRVTLEFTP